MKGIREGEEGCVCWRCVRSGMKSSTNKWFDSRPGIELSLRVIHTLWRPFTASLAARILGFFFGVLVIPISVLPQQPSATEYRSKANFLANLPGFVEWPKSAFKSPQAPFVVCVIGEFSFGTAFAEGSWNMAPRRRPIEVRWLRKEQALYACHVIYVSRSEDKRYTKILGAVQGTDKLTIGETPNFLDAGGAIVFSFEPEGLRFDVNLRATKAAHLKISSNLLALARRVLNTPGADKS